MTVVGVDVSSRRIDLAWIQNGRPQRWHQVLDGKHLIDRLRSTEILWPASVSEVCIEMPFSINRQSDAALMAAVGCITRSAPWYARVSWISSGDLRAAIGAKNMKDSAHVAVASRYPTLVGIEALGDDLTPYWYEHELDALVACLGWSEILAAQDAA